MSRSIWGLVALPIFFSPIAVRAQEGTAPRATAQGAAPVSPSAAEPEVGLDELIARAQANSPSPRIAAANLEAARERAGALRSLPNPVLQAVPGVGGSNNSRNEELILSQSLDLFGQRRAQRATLNAQTRQAQAEADLAGRLLVIEVKNAAAGLFAAQEAESLGVSQVEIATAFRDAAARKAALGDAPAVQAQRAGLELDRAQNDLDGARAERLARRATLNQIIDQAPET
ncbi:MAG: TolC family protein, partial [Alphaproteobacteria bacterium]